MQIWNLKRKDITKRDAIVIINHDSGYLIIDLANAYTLAGFDVTLISGRLVQRDKALDKGVKFKKIICYNRNNTFKRLATWIIATLQIIFLICFSYRNNKLLIFSNPPSLPLVPLLFKNPFSLVIYDVFPDAYIEAGVLSNKSIVAKIWRIANIKSYAKADNIFTITEGMKNILSQYADKSRIEVVPVWTNNNFFKPISQLENKFILQHGLQGKFIVLYSGNLGTLNDVEVLIEIASKINCENAFFIIIGKGVKYSQIVKKVESKRLNNFLILPWQEASELPYTFAAASLAVVAIGKAVSKIGIPSKVYNFMSVGVPILGLASEGSDLEILVNQHHLGKCFEPDKQQDILEFIQYMIENKAYCNELHENSLKASTLFTDKNVYQFIGK